MANTPTPPVQPDQLPGLMAAVQRGDKAAYGQVLGYVAQRVRPFLLSRLRSADDAEDVIQEVLVSVHKARATFDPTRPFDPWLFSIAQFRLNDFLRRQYRRDGREVIDTDMVARQSDTVVTERAENSEIMEELGAAMATLPKRQQAIVTLMKVQGYSAQEVADRLNMSVSNVKVTAHRAYKALRAYFDKNGGPM